MPLQPHETAFTQAPAPPRPVPVIADAAAALAIADTLAAAFAEAAVARDLERRLPVAEVERFSESGLWAITVPKAYGGPGLDSATVAQVIARIAAADGSLGQIPQNHFYALEVLRNGGTEAQKRDLYGRVLAGERFGNALAEIGARDHTRRTRLVRDPAGWFVEGRKYYCTGSLYAHRIPTLVEAEEAGRTATYLVFIPRDAPGVTLVDDWDGFGQRVTGSGSVLFERVAVEPRWVVPFQASLERPTAIGPFAQILHAGIDLGIGEGAFAATLPFVRDRARPWIDSGVTRASEDPLTLHALGDVQVRLAAADALLTRAGRFVDAAQDAPDADNVAAASVAVAEARAASHRAGLLASNRLLELGGTSATDRAEALDRYWRNVRTHTLHDPVRWKYHWIGAYHLDGRLPPRHGAL
ncbi:SfnB family sulfur acquisition oxidoreductase [Methylobacterium sp. 092160098-2]|uniref:SfnB family sulfur acquisition oxidoreductase n=1 Tax=Methylobacterium sp. 092160098-2 TaxID=3025129 RepID=UPI002381B19D|nr:SfnB family sulfur acquisition oxidoreductase [Methylobacterium sp. 092160098-2]MDE4911163.1 SfnB family sulfur acquisition oxidoreductase [Methylobacterium sp. 092160098-2]